MRALNVLVATTIATAPLAAQSAGTPTPDSRPTVAVMNFTGGALIRAADYAAMGQGITELLVTMLAGNPDVRVAERHRLDEILAEHKLSASGQLDPATAVEIGRVLGVRHFISGGFLVDTRERMRVDVRSVNVETSEIEYRETIEGDVKSLFELIDRIGRKLSAGIKLPQSGYVAAAKPSGRVDETKAVALLGRASAAAAKGDTTAALAAVREALKVYPDFGRAKDLEAALLTKKAP